MNALTRSNILSAILSIAFISAPFIVSAQSTGDISAQIQNLLDQVKALQTRLASLQTAASGIVQSGIGGSTGPDVVVDRPGPDGFINQIGDRGHEGENGNTPEMSSEEVAVDCPVLSRRLQYGMRGTDVKDLQSLLGKQGLLPGEPTSFFGVQTQGAVQRLQTKLGIVSSGDPISTGWGTVGPATIAGIGRMCGHSGSRTIACTRDAKICPDGSTVGRTGPHCEFAACPGTTPPLSCTPRPACLDATPRCLPPEPAGGWCSASTTGKVSIQSLSPLSGPIGTLVAISGHGFGTGITAHNKILMNGNVAAENVFSSSGDRGHEGDQHLRFNIPTSLSPNCPSDSVCPQFQRLVTPATYRIAVQNDNGVSDSIPFTVTGDSIAPIESPICAADVRQCSDGSFVSRTGPHCEFAACPGTIPPQACTRDAKVCPDGSSVGRTGPHCEFVCSGGVTPPPTQIDISTCPIIARSLSLGSRGDDVKRLQQVLVDENLLDTDSITGFFGAATKAALGNWQVQHGIITDSAQGGVVGSRTREWLKSGCGGGTNGSSGGNVSTNPFFASPTSGHAPLTVRFSHVTGDGSANDYTFDFGDGATGSPVIDCGNLPNGSDACPRALTASHTYTIAGRYTTQLIKKGEICRDNNDGQGVSCGSPGSPDRVVGSALITVTATGTTQTCTPRPACLDATPRCLPPEPIGGWCPVNPPQGCTRDAKICPDGSSVGRTGPNCSFATCPVPGIVPGGTGPVQ